MGNVQDTEKYFARFPLKKFSKGQIIIYGGDEPGHIHYLTKGKVRQYYISDRGDELVVNVFKPGSFFPMNSAFTDTPNIYFYDAEVYSEIRLAPRENTIAFLKENPDVLFGLLSRLYTGIEGLLQRMVHLMGSSAGNRLLYEMIIEGRRFGVINSDGSCMLSIDESDLAARAGLARETVSREMHKLNGEGLVEIGRKQILIKNLTKLEEKLGTEL